MYISRLFALFTAIAFFVLAAGQAQANVVDKQIVEPTNYWPNPADRSSNTPPARNFPDAASWYWFGQCLTGSKWAGGTPFFQGFSTTGNGDYGQDYDSIINDDNRLPQNFEHMVKGADASNLQKSKEWYYSNPFYEGSYAPSSLGVQDTIYGCAEREGHPWFGVTRKGVGVGTDCPGVGPNRLCTNDLEYRRQGVRASAGTTWVGLRSIWGSCKGVSDHNRSVLPQLLIYNENPRPRPFRRQGEDSTWPNDARVFSPSPPNGCSNFQWRLGSGATADLSWFGAGGPPWWAAARGMRTDSFIAYAAGAENLISGQDYQLLGGSRDLRVGLLCSASTYSEQYVFNNGNRADRCDDWRAEKYRECVDRNNKGNCIKWEDRWRWASKKVAAGQYASLSNALFAVKDMSPPVFRSLTLGGSTPYFDDLQMRATAQESVPGTIVADDLGGGIGAVSLFINGSEVDLSTCVPAIVRAKTSHSQANSLPANYEENQEVTGGYSAFKRPCPGGGTYSDWMDLREGLNHWYGQIWEYSSLDHIPEVKGSRSLRWPSQGIGYPLLLDTAAPVFSKDVRCRAFRAGEENGWYQSDPQCVFQSYDRYKECASDFNWGEFASCANQSPVARKASTSWSSDIKSGYSTSNNNLLAPDNKVEGLTDTASNNGRPILTVSSADRVGNSDDKVYKDFVKVDTKKPSALEIIDGPSETEPSGYFGKYGDNPLPPDETNDSSSGASPNPENDDCVLCWTVEGLEIADGTNPSPEDISSGNIPFDFDHPAKLQCQLLYSGTGRSPSRSLANWERAPWPSDGAWSAWQRPSWSPLGAFWSGSDNYQGAGSIIYQSSGANGSQIVADTGWNCLKSDPRGLETEAAETVAPFTMAGRVNGHYLFRVRQKDRAGNVGPWKGRPMLYDTTSPETGALSRARVYNITDSLSSAKEEEQSVTKQWLFDWGWDLLQVGEKASVYCFIRNTDTEEIVRRSGWGCGGVTSTGPRIGAETPMPWPGVNGEGAGTLAGLPDGNYEVGFIQRDKLGQVSSFDSAPTLPFTKNGNTIGEVAPPKIELEALLDAQSVTSRRTSATLKVRTPLVNGQPQTLLPGQAFFPMQGWIAHYTPQELYSYCQKMTDNYSEYSAEDWSGKVKEISTEDSAPNCPDEVSGYSGEPYQNEEGVQVPTEVRFGGGLTLDEDTLNGDTTVDSRQGTFILDIFWLQPTRQVNPEAEILGGLGD